MFNEGLTPPYLIIIVKEKCEMDLEQEVKVCQLPKRPRGLHSTSKFNTVEIITNFYHVETKPMD